MDSPLGGGDLVTQQLQIGSTLTTSQDSGYLQAGFGPLLPVNQRNFRISVGTVGTSPISTTSVIGSETPVRFRSPQLAMLIGLRPGRRSGTAAQARVRLTKQEPRRFRGGAPFEISSPRIEDGELILPVFQAGWR